MTETFLSSPRKQRILLFSEYSQIGRIGFIQLDSMGKYGYISHMKTTIEIDDSLLAEATEIYKFKTKRETIEAGLKELIQTHKRKKLAGMFGKQKDIKPVRRTR